MWHEDLFDNWSGAREQLFVGYYPLQILEKTDYLCFACTFWTLPWREFFPSKSRSLTSLT